MHDTSGGMQATTQPEGGDRREIEVKTEHNYEVITDARYTAGSTPSGLPEVAEGAGYVFRIGEGYPLNQVVITIDTGQLTEQARIRKVNQAIRRARRR